MKNQVATDKQDLEIAAIARVHDALKGLDQQAQIRILDYVVKKLGLPSQKSLPSSTTEDQSGDATAPKASASTTEKTEPSPDDELAGISPVAQKWLRRNGIQIDKLSSIFSLGVDEIDLVAKTVPGDSKAAKMHSVLLLKGIAAYLSTGAARITHEQLKETCLHYNAYDSANFAAHMKDFAAEASGSKETGYTLTARGLTNATAVVKQVTHEAKE